MPTLLKILVICPPAIILLKVGMEKIQRFVSTRVVTQTLQSQLTIGNINSLYVNYASAYEVKVCTEFHLYHVQTL